MTALSHPQEITDINQLDFSKRYTYADYLTWKFMERVELFRGWIAKMSAPTTRHQRVSYKFTAELFQYFKGKQCQPYVAPFDVRLPNPRKSTADNQVYTVVQPDLCVICDQDKLDKRGCIGAPDWVVEILSPSNNKKETDIKFSLYEEAGVREYWVVAPGCQTVTVFTLQDEKFAFQKIWTNEDTAVPVSIFEGLTINLTEVFAE